MKYMFIMRATDEAIEASKQVPFEEILNQMGAYNEQLIKAGVMLAGEGLTPVRGIGLRGRFLRSTARGDGRPLRRNA